MELNFEFFGNSGVVARLDQKLRSGRLPHAMAFAGPEGVGKRTCALRIAQALNCVRGDGVACGSCPQCSKIAAHTHPDVFVVELEDDARQIKIEQVRRLRSRLELQPMEGAATVFLIDPASRMGPGAANALLKALEEAPEGTYIVLIATNIYELPITIRSRCQVYRFAPLTLAQIRQAGVEDELLARWCQGSIGRALAHDVDDLRTRRDAALAFLTVAVSATPDDVAGLLAASGELSRSKEDYSNHIRLLGVLISDLIHVQAGTDRVVNIDIETQLRDIANRMDLERLIQIADVLRFIESNMKSYLNRQMMTDVLALTSGPDTGEILNDKAWTAR